MQSSHTSSFFQILHKYKTVAIGICIFVIAIGGYILVQSFYIYQIPQPIISRTGNQKTAGYSTFQAIPQRIVDAIIAVEDKRFRTHHGIDLLALGRATYQTTIRSNTQGGSTIDQQLIKLTDKAFSRSRTRKIYEMRMANNLQFHHNKKEILLTYINSIPFSHGIQGRSAACDIYFHKTCDYLSDAELSYLFAVAQLGINPYKENNQSTINTRASILCNILTNTHIAIQENGCAVLHPQQDNTASKTNNSSGVNTTGSSDILSGNIATTGIKLPTKKGFILGNTTRQTTYRPIKLYKYQGQVDPKIQLFLDSLTDSTQATFSQEQYNRIENILKTTQTHRQLYDAQYCCIVAVDKNGGLISMNTCSDRDESTKAGKINSCTDARQVGSAIKPFLYTFAFHEKGLHAHDSIVDEPISFDLGDGSTYSPKNFDLQYRGEVTLAYALGNSLNVPAIKLLHTVGVESFLEFLKEQLAIYATGQDNNQKNAENVGLSLALGTYEISPYAFTQLWRFLLVGESPSKYTQSTKEIVDILSNPNNRVAAFGQDSFLNLPGRAVKTGTSRKFIDARVCGVNNSKGITLCLWMGNIDNQSMKGPSSEIGSYIWNMIAKGM